MYGHTIASSMDGVCERPSVGVPRGWFEEGSYSIESGAVWPSRRARHLRALFDPTETRPRIAVRPVSSLDLIMSPTFVNCAPRIGPKLSNAAAVVTFVHGAGLDGTTASAIRVRTRRATRARRRRHRPRADRLAMRQQTSANPTTARPSMAQMFTTPNARNSAISAQHSQAKACVVERDLMSLPRPFRRFRSSTVARAATGSGDGHTAFSGVS